MRKFSHAPRRLPYITVAPRCGAITFDREFAGETARCAHGKYIRTPSVYQLGAPVRDEEWELAIFNVANCGYYIPHVLLPSVRYNKDFPLVHLLYKALPQRCQFRNFSNVALQYMDKYPQCEGFFKNVLLWSLTGVHYMHSDAGLGLQRRLQLYHAFIVDPIDFKAFFKSNVRLLFFVVKEYFIYLVNMQPGLRDALCTQHNWDRYETEITHIMNKIRYIFEHEDNDPWTTIKTLITKYIPRQIKCMRPKSMPYRRQLVDYMWRNLPTMTWCGTSLNDFAERFRQVEFVLSHDAEWCRLAYARPLGSKKSLNHYQSVWAGAIATMSPTTQRVVGEWAGCARVVADIHLIDLPAHTVLAQKRTLRRRHDLEPDCSEADYTSVSSYYICIRCQCFRGFVPSGAAGKSNCYAYGHRGLSYNYDTGAVYCASGTHRKKKKPDSSDAHPCIQIPLLGKVLSIFGERYTICIGCGATCKFGVVEGYKGDVLCGYCTQRSSDSDVRHCAYCLRTSGAGKYIRFDCYNDVQRPQQWESIWLCAQHRRNLRVGCPVLKSALLRT